DVRLESLARDPVEDAGVLRDDGLHGRLVAHALAEERRIRAQSLRVERAQDRHGLVERLTADEPGATEAQSIAAHEPGDERVVRRQQDAVAEAEIERRFKLLAPRPARSARGREFRFAALLAPTRDCGLRR